HRLVDQVVDRALELCAHLLEDLPEIVAALELPESLLVLIVVHCLSPEPRSALVYSVAVPAAPSAGASAGAAACSPCARRARTVRATAVATLPSVSWSRQFGPAVAAVSPSSAVMRSRSA